MGNPFIHVELACDDTGAAKNFYKAVFDWKLSDDPKMGYTMLDVGKGVGGGMMKKQMPQQPTAWLPYVQVADVKKSLDKARAGGANVVVDYTPIGDMGAIGVFIDPAGASLGVWESARKAAAAPKKAKAKAKAKPAKKKATKKGKR